MSSNTNYQALVGLGVVFVAAGVATSTEGLMGLGVIFMILGVVKRDET
jgi:hypothetical protein